ncbi:MAG: SIS domain-containing protein [Lachnospiraceae bacterium]|nr:SIS domain-containing protein [Lachnospiraceae bacterium]
MNGNDRQILAHIDETIERYPALAPCKADIKSAYMLLKETFERGNQLLVAGNGGSAADSEHIAGELMKKFRLSRHVPPEFADRLKAVDKERGEKLAANLEQSLTAIPLVAHEALTTAFFNDVDSVGVFAQQLYGYGKSGDVFIGISTSGNSENIINAAVCAKAMGIKVIALTGETGGKLAGYADIAIKVPGSETYLIQEMHLPVYHCLCMMLEEKFFGSAY